jgi:hypothetical protein
MNSEKLDVINTIPEKVLLTILDNLAQNDTPIDKLRFARLKAKNEMLCGSLAHLYALKLLKENSLKRCNVQLVFLWSPNITLLEQLDFTSKSVNLKDIQFDPDNLATHAVVEVKFENEANKQYVVDPTSGVLYHGTVRSIRNQSKNMEKNCHENLESIEFIGSQIFRKNKESTTSYRIFYTTSFYWSTVIGQTYVNNLDSNLERIN